ncbi:hypothetical protein JRO89_XS10G0054700 [Xanthoceras sorbifolium]|uniref:Uncharacterized protein n=1 Tax=Xanthoceras sorbifolium TaxID=99658 RepID=A0ABQ8HHR1_9ROSI|nr:hypothetical protein JRO89_XS10G0054700 [Xanthoceras sorbifolium]
MSLSSRTEGRKVAFCAESALQYVLGDLSRTYFVGNAPMGHMVILPTDKVPDIQNANIVALVLFAISEFDSFLYFFLGQQFFFKSQVIATNKFKIGKCEDFVWITKDELLEYLPEQAEFLNKMIIS